jgi:hypothetical protein
MRDHSKMRSLTTVALGIVPGYAAAVHLGVPVAGRAQTAAVDEKVSGTFSVVQEPFRWSLGNARVALTTSRPAHVAPGLPLRAAEESKQTIGTSKSIRRSR